MSRRNMSERVNCGLMLCQGIAPLNGGTSTPGSSPLRSSDEDRNLSILNSLVPGGVADKNEFRPLTQLLQNIGQSNKDGSTPIDAYNLRPESVKLLRDFMAKVGVPGTGESQKRGEVLDTMQQTFGLSDTQVNGLTLKSLDKDALRYQEDLFRQFDDPSKILSGQRQESLRLWEEQNAKYLPDPGAVREDLLRSNALGL
jgi:hypothetical protein